MGLIMFNGHSSLDYGIQVETPPEYTFPEREYLTEHVPGRNGDILIDYGSYQNVERLYNVSVGSLSRNSYTQITNRLSQWLHTGSGYCRLEDSYEPDYYRLAYYMEKGAITNIYNEGGKIDIVFNCKPQRFLKIGEKPIVSTSSPFYAYNPTQYPSKPLIKVTGTISANPSQIKISQNGVDTYTIGVTFVYPSTPETIIIDSELQDAYSVDGTGNKNSQISLSNGEFPQLLSGNNGITFTGSITSVEVIPNWWTL